MIFGLNVLPFFGSAAGAKLPSLTCCNMATMLSETLQTMILFSLNLRVIKRHLRTSSASENERRRVNDDLSVNEGDSGISSNFVQSLSWVIVRIMGVPARGS